MSKIVKRHSVEFRKSPNPRSDLTKAIRSSKSPQIRNNLQNRTKLDIKIIKVSKPASESNQPTSIQRPQHRPLFRTGTGSIFAPTPKDKIHRESGTPVFSNPVNSTAGKHGTETNKNMHLDQSPSLFTTSRSGFKPIRMHSTPNSSDSSSKFFEPDSTIDDDDLEPNFILDSNKLTDSSILTKHTKLSIPIYGKTSSKPKTGPETPKKNLSVKKLTEYKTNSAKIKTPIASKSATTKTKLSKEKNGQNFSQDLQTEDEFYTPPNTCSFQHRISAKKTTTPVQKEVNPPVKKSASRKGSNLETSSQPRIQTRAHSTPVISGLSNSKTKPKNSPQIRQIPSTPRPKSKSKIPSPELFVDDHDSNELPSSADLVLPSSEDLIEPERISVFRNRLKTQKQVLNSSIYSQCFENVEWDNTSRYQLRSKTSTPVTYELPSIRRQRSNSQQSVRSKFGESPKSKADLGISALAKSNVNRSLQFSQLSSVHGSLLEFSTPQDTLTDVYDFESVSAPIKRRPQTNRKKPSQQPKAQNESIPEATFEAATTVSKPFVNPPVEFSQFSSIHGSLINLKTPQDTPKDIYEFVSNSPPTKRQPRARRTRLTIQKRSRAPRSTPVKKPAQPKPIVNPLFSTAFNESLNNVSSPKSTTTPKSRPVGNPNAFSEITNQFPKKGRVNVSKTNKPRSDNFLTSSTSQFFQTLGQRKSMFSTPASEKSRNFLSSNSSINSQPVFLNRATTPSQNQINSSQTYGNLLAHIDRINHNENDVEMQELSDLFGLLKVSDISIHAKSAFMNYRDPGGFEKFSARKKDNPTSCGKPRKISFVGNTFMNYRMPSDSIAEENEIPFSKARAPAKNCALGGINSHSFKFTAGDTPAKSKDATDETNLSVRDALRGVKYISRKVPHYFYDDGDYNLDGFSDWD